MGFSCIACQSCGDQTYEIVFGNCVLEPFQNKMKDVKQLNKYDKFYRVVCDPFHSLKVWEYSEDLQEL
jgi:hypothetical protein